MSGYKEAYYKLFTAISETSDLIENLLPEIEEENKAKKLLEVQVKNLKTIQQLTEEIIISD